jgi:hypothetical protein
MFEVTQGAQVDPVGRAGRRGLAFQDAG